MKLLGLQSLIYGTKDIKTDTAWWTKTLGYEPYFTADEYVGFDVGGYEIGLFVALFDFPDGGITYIGVEDMDACYQELLDSGCEPHEKPSDVGGDIKMASVTNPAGQIIGIIYNPHFGKNKE